MSFKTAWARVLGVPVHVWVLLAFGIAYLLFLIGPVFLRTNQMQFYRYILAGDHLGIDLKFTLSWSQYWLHGGPAPDNEGTYYPPLASIMLIPLLAVKFNAAYRIVTFATVFLYAFTVLVLPLWMSGQKGLSVTAVLVCASGLVSYGLQFEIERGQTSVIAIALALIAIWLFHEHPKWRLLAYVVFVIAVQLKLYPIIFLPMFCDDWRDLRSNLRRLSLLLLVNVLLIAATVPQGIGPWLGGIQRAEVFIWVGNPSVYSAMIQLGNFAAGRGWNWLIQHAGLISVLGLIPICICILITLMQAYRRNDRGPSPYYLLAAAIGCLLIPTSSQDYRLPTLGAPLVLVLVAETVRPVESRPMPALLRRLILFVFAFAYASTLFPSMQKPFYLADNFPALVIMLLAVTYLALTSVHPAGASGESVQESGGETVAGSLG